MIVILIDGVFCWGMYRIHINNQLMIPNLALAIKANEQKIEITRIHADSELMRTKLMLRDELKKHQDQD